MDPTFLAFSARCRLQRLDSEITDDIGELGKCQVLGLAATEKVLKCISAYTRAIDKSGTVTIEGEVLDVAIQEFIDIIEILEATNKVYMESFIKQEGIMKELLGAVINIKTSYK